MVPKSRQTYMSGLVTNLNGGFVVNDFVSKRFLFVVVCAVILSGFLMLFFSPAVAAVCLFVAIAVWLVPYGRQLKFDSDKCVILESRLFWWGPRESKRWSFGEIIAIDARETPSDRPYPRFVLTMSTVTGRISICSFTFTRDNAGFWAELGETIRTTLNSDPERTIRLPPTIVIEQTAKRNRGQWRAHNPSGA